MAQLVERSLLSPEICGSNPVITKNVIYKFVSGNREDEESDRKWPLSKKRFSPRGEMLYDSGILTN